MFPLILIMAPMYQVFTTCQTLSRVLDHESSQQRWEVGPILILFYG